MNIPKLASPLIIRIHEARSAASLGERLSLRVNAAWMLSGNVVYAASQWGMLVALTKLVSPEEVGFFAFGLAVAAPIILFASLNLRAVQATDAKDEHNFGQYLGLRLILTLFAFFAISSIVWISDRKLEVVLIVIALSVAKSFESVSDIFFGLFQKHERLDRIALSLMIKGPLSLLVFALIVWITESVFFGALSLAVTWLIILLTFDLRNGRRYASIRPNFKVRSLTALAWQALPLGIVLLLISLKVNMPRYVIEQSLGARQLGIFAALAYLPVAGTIVVSALGQSASPRLAQYYANEDKAAYRRLLLRLLAVGAALGVLGILVAKTLGSAVLNIIYTPEYGEHADLLVWLMVVAAVLYTSTFLGVATTAMRRFWIQVLIQLTSISIILILSLLLIHEFGMIGVTWAMLAGVIFSAVIYGFIALYPRKAHEIQNPRIN